jgi:hypothetical protein
MIGRSPVKVVYVQQPIPVRKTSYRGPHYGNSRMNQVSPRPIFTCIDEVYSTSPAPYPVLQPTYIPMHMSSHKSKDDSSIFTQKHRKWLLTLLIIIIISCIIAIVILLAVFLSR